MRISIARWMQSIPRSARPTRGLSLNWIAFVSGQDDGLPKAAVTSTGGMTTDSDGVLALKVFV
jgi:hypothetical protein